MDKLCQIRDIRRNLISWAEQHQECPDQMIPLYGQVIDMIKDSYEMEKDAYKSLYYEMAAKAICMDMGEDMNERAGYDHWRTTSGRFARKGTGHYSRGYHPNPNPLSEMMPMDMRGDIWEGDGPRMSATHGKAYSDFDMARRHYHESKDPEMRKEMDTHAMEHAKEIVLTSKDIYKDASPEMKQKLKSEFTKMMSDINAM